MFGSIPAMQTVYSVLSAVTDVTDAVGTRMHGMTVLPEGDELPGLIYYPVTPGQYDGPLNSDGTIDAEMLQLDVKFLCLGASADPITPAVLAAFTALNGHKATVDGLNLTFSAAAEIPFMTLIEEGQTRTQLGITFNVEIMAGG